MEKLYKCEKCKEPITAKERDWFAHIKGDKVIRVHVCLPCFEDEQFFAGIELELTDDDENWLQNLRLRNKKLEWIYGDFDGDFAEYLIKGGIN